MSAGSLDSHGQAPPPCSQPVVSKSSSTPSSRVPPVSNIMCCRCRSCTSWESKKARPLTAQKLNAPEAAESRGPGQPLCIHKMAVIKSQAQQVGQVEATRLKGARPEVAKLKGAQGLKLPQGRGHQGLLTTQVKSQLRQPLQRPQGVHHVGHSKDVFFIAKVEDQLCQAAQLCKGGSVRGGQRSSGLSPTLPVASRLSAVKRGQNASASTRTLSGISLPRSLSAASSRAGRQDTRLMQASASTMSLAATSFTPAALRASQRLAAHAASEAGPLCVSAVKHQAAWSSTAERWRGSHTAVRDLRLVGLPAIVMSKAVRSVQRQSTGADASSMATHQRESRQVSSAKSIQAEIWPRFRRKP